MKKIYIILSLLSLMLLTGCGDGPYEVGTGTALAVKACLDKDRVPNYKSTYSHTSFTCRAK